MTDAIKDSALRILRQMDEKLDRLIDDVNDLKVHMTNVEENLAGVHRRLDRVEARLDRVERRLDLADATT